MILQVKKKTITRGETISTHHQPLLVRALWHEVTKAHPLVRVIVMMKCPSYDEIVQQNLNYAKACTTQQKRLEKLKGKLDSSQEAYKTLLEQYENFANLNVELSTKIEQLEASATTNACTINDEQLVKKNEKLKRKVS